MSTATRSSCSTSTCGGCCRSARRRSPASAISTSTARASSTRGGWPSVALHFFQQYRSRWPRAAVRGLGRLRRRRAAARFRRVDDVVAVNLDFLDHPERSRHLQPRHRAARRRSTRWRRRRSTRAARRDGRGAATLARARARRRDRVRPVSAGARRQVPELHAGRSRARCARAGYAAPMTTVDEGVAALRRTADCAETRILRVT